MGRQLSRAEIFKNAPLTPILKTRRLTNEVLLREIKNNNRDLYMSQASAIEEKYERRSNLERGESSSLPTYVYGGEGMHPLPRFRVENAYDGTVTPQIMNRRLELELKREEHAIEDDWSCCLCKRRTDSRLIRYIVQMTIILSIMGLCLFELARTHDCSRQNLFLSLLTLMLGVIIPQPSVSRK